MFLAALVAVILLLKNDGIAATSRTTHDPISPAASDEIVADVCRIGEKLNRVLKRFRFVCHERNLTLGRMSCQVYYCPLEEGNSSNIPRSRGFKPSLAATAREASDTRDPTYAKADA